MKMKAAVMTAVSKPLEVREVELDPPKSDEVLVKILATAVCHSDLNVLNDPTTPIPQVLGHEGAGEVVQVGSNVKTCKVGDKVVLSWDPACGTCAFCRTGKTNLCESAFGPMFGGTLMDGTSRLHMDGKPAYHMSLLSTFAEYTVVPEMSCVKVPDEMPMVPACMIGCGVATGFGAAVRAAKVTPGSSVAVFGLGGVGTNAIQGAKIAGASIIIACDIKDDNLEQAKKYGATHIINTLKVDDVPAAIKELTEGLGVDFAIDCTGNTKVGRMAWMSGRKGSTTVVIGAYPEDGELTIPAGSFHRVGKILKGSFYGDINPFNDFPIIAQMYLDGKYDLDSLVIEKIPLEDINKAFDAFGDPNANNMGRYIISFE
ncbi:MAG: Zn-dependent alcohol dehydrogenase [Eubacteriaceae bacterium]|jgi:S-(hydroxymethyl)glutathione dehydrogenase/alcohol dehydrogenase|nr:Zn-dependent alcohol dehydrogenase [Eubacteriaceae bacterium]